MNPLFLHNTLSGKKEEFKPIKKGAVSMYHCGPTVYDYAHVGNLKAYVFSDILRRVFEYNGYSIDQVMNITDVGHLVGDGDEGDDKMTKALKRDNKPLTLEAMHEIGDFYFKQFKKDLEALNIELPQHFPKASEHIEDDIDLIRELESKGFAYTLDDGIYFDTSKFPSYGKLGHIDIKGLMEGARVAINSAKRNPIDFILWKRDAKIGWESPWGKGFPGWHIECSAMSRKYLGQPFDIHTGGIDHIPVHHNNEIAQSEAAYGVPLAHYWMHSAFITVDDTKMAKSAGNFITLATLHDNLISPIGYRYWLLTSHYRSPINFSFDAVLAAQTALFKLCQDVISWQEGNEEESNLIADNINKKYQKEFNEAINDDLNTPQALALLWKLVKDASLSPAEKRATVLDFDRVFGLRLSELSPIPEKEVPEEVKALAEARELARESKEWQKADALRQEIESRGYIVKDTSDGFTLQEI